MGRKKILIKPIECPRLRSVTFYKRRKGLLKKAMELAVLCQSHVFLAFVDNETGKLITFNSHSHDELQNLFRKTPMHLREQFKTEDYDMLYGGGESAMKPKGKRRTSTLRVKEEDDDYGYELESEVISERPHRKPKREIKSRSKNISRNSRNRKNVMRIMGPHGSARYSYQEMKSSSPIQDSEEEEDDDYYDEDSHERHHYYKSRQRKEHHGYGDAYHQSSICDIINVFEDEPNGNRSEVEHVEEYHRKQNHRGHHHRGTLKGPSSRKLKAKLKLEDLDIGELAKEKRYSENQEEDVPYKYTKQQSFHFKGKKQQSGQIERSEAAEIEAKKTNIHSAKESQGTNHLQTQQSLLTPMMYHHLQMGGMPPGAYPPAAMGPVAPHTPTIKDYSPYPMLMTPSPFPRFLVPGFGGPTTGQSSDHYKMGIDIPTSGLFPAASPIYSYAGLMQTPVELRSSFNSGQPIFKQGGIQQKQSMQNLEQLTSEKMRKGSQFSFIEGQRNKDDSGSIQPRQWYQSLLEMHPQLANPANDLSNSNLVHTENQQVESPKHEQKKTISPEEVVRKGEEPQ